ncbi:arsenate reductase/protein-tyrosine-phosphatase family protein [Kocuria sp.]|uniref:arsenate reductase/protein-tyrosine-phosphatase family protein n=1 Tax=Kocuria sp. TaxID=1871328 RepID=UPI0026DF5277|nr:low molecular weight phosphatase family protein [Kocuria sp.]MDO5619712.1 low molecular weight phosphatase family protein [Kocuria sp.]
MTVNILTVCTGNICRSPWAERYLQLHLDDLAPTTFQVTSAGTFALTGEPMDPLSEGELIRVGGTAQDFTARQLTENVLAEAHLVLGMTTEHRDQVLSMTPRLLKRAFTVREFAHLLAQLPADTERTIPRGAQPETVTQRWKTVPRLLSSLRGSGMNSEMNVGDPYRLGPEAFASMVDQLRPALDQLIDHERKWQAPLQA